MCDRLLAAATALSEQFFKVQIRLFARCDVIYKPVLTVKPLFLEVRAPWSVAAAHTFFADESASSTSLAPFSRFSERLPEVRIDCQVECEHIEGELGGVKLPSRR